MQHLLISIQRDPLLGAINVLQGPKILFLCIWTFGAQEINLQESIRFIFNRSEDNYVVKRDAPGGAETDSGTDAMAARACSRARNDSTGKLDYKCYICTADCILSGGSMRSGRPGNSIGATIFVRKS